MFKQFHDLVKDDEGYDATVKGRVLIIDGDTFCYKASSPRKVNGEPVYPKLSTAINRFQTDVIAAMIMTGAETAIVHLTHKDSYKSGRHRIKGWKPYQSNRVGAERPPLLHVVREEVCKPEHAKAEYVVHLHKAVEADDAVMIDSYKFGENGLLWSEDKDLRHTPYDYYDQRDHRIKRAKGIGELWIHTTSRGLDEPEDSAARRKYQSLSGVGRIFFWAQMMMGDTVDSIRGLDKFDGKNIGWARTFEVLEKFNHAEDESPIANFVIDAYRKIDQNPIPEGYLLHMMRDWGDSFHNVLQEVELSEANHRFIWEDCMLRDWYDKEEQYGD